MAGKTISQRISLEGSDDIRKKLQELGAAGEKAFKQIQDAAKQPITDPAQVDKTRQAIDQLVVASTKLGQQFRTLTGETQSLGTAGAKAGENIAAGFKSAATEVNNLGIRIGVVSGLVQAATNKLLSMAGALRQALSPAQALKGTVETGKAISDQADKLKISVQEWLKLSKVIAAAGVSQETFIAGASGLAKKIADAKGGFAELMPGTLVSTSKGAVAVMTDLAKSISMLGDSAQAARLGTAAFGANWKEIIKALTGGKAAADAAEDVFDKLAKVDRALSPDHAEKAARLAKGWDVLGKAIRAAKDQIGTVLLDSALLRAEWLIRLIDGARELFKTWQQLAEAKKAAFLEGLGDSPAEFIFKTLIALGQQLAGIWNGVLVPAGEKLMGIFGQIAGSFEGVSKSQVAAFFITAAAAAVGLALALKGLGLLLTPLSLLLSLFSPFGAVLLAAGAAALVFWEQISAGAAKAGELIPAELQAIAASFQKLFAGDFTGFWEQFSAAAVSAFQKIAQAAQATPWVQSLIDGFKQFASELPGAIQTVIQILMALGNAATWVAEKINGIFGTQLTGTDIAIIAIVAQFTGALAALAAAAVIVSSAVGIVVGVLGLLVTAFGAVPVAIGIIVTVLAALAAALITINWDSIAATGVAAWDAIVTAITGAITAVANFASSLAGIAWDAIKSAGVAAWEAITGAIKRAIDALLKFIGLRPSGSGGSGAAPAKGFARGGRIGGRGSGTSDSNLAWLSRGEYVMPASAVRKPGMLAFLEMLRRGGGIPGYAEGGLVREDRSAGVLADMIKFLDGLANSVADIYPPIMRGLVDVTDSIKRIVLDLHSALTSVVRNIEEKMVELIADLAQIEKLKQQDIASGHASGGLLGGRGSGTSDSNLAWVSRGEHIMPARAVRQPGVLMFLEMLRRSGGDLRRVLDGMGRFAMGGPVAMPAMAGGVLGGMAHLGTVDLRTEHGSVRLMASPDAVEQLSRLAVTKRMTSTGRKPGFIG